MSTIEHHPELGRFQTTTDGKTSLIAYRIAGDLMSLTHTEVAPELQGQGIGGQLVEAALAHAKAHGLTVDPACSYARAYMQRHGLALSQR